MTLSGGASLAGKSLIRKVRIREVTIKLLKTKMFFKGLHKRTTVFILLGLLINDCVKNNLIN